MALNEGEWPVSCSALPGCWDAQHFLCFLLLCPTQTSPQMEPLFKLVNKLISNKRVDGTTPALISAKSSLDPHRGLCHFFCPGLQELSLCQNSGTPPKKKNNKERQICVPSCHQGSTHLDVNGRSRHGPLSNSPPVFCLNKIIKYVYI